MLFGIVLERVLSEVLHESALLVKTIDILLQYGIILENLHDVAVTILCILRFVEAQQVAVGIWQVALLAQPHVQLPDELCPAHVHTFRSLCRIGHVAVVGEIHAVHELVGDGFPSAEGGIVTVEVPVGNSPGSAAAQSAVCRTALSEYEVLRLLESFHLALVSVGREWNPVVVVEVASHHLLEVCHHVLVFWCGHHIGVVGGDDYPFAGIDRSHLAEVV